MAELSPPSLDVPAILTNLVILVGFIAAIFAGLWKGWKEIKSPPKAPSVGDPASITGNATLEFMRASLEEAQSMRELRRSNEDLHASLRELDRDLENMAEELRQNRLSLRGAGESMDRLILAIERNTQAIEKAWR